MLPAAAAAVLLLALSFGGGTFQGLRSDALVQLASLPLLFLALSRLVKAPPGAAARAPLALAAGAVLLPLVQLVPLPPLLWTALPGREFAASALEAAGLAPGFRPVSLDPGATWRAVLALLPPLAVFLAVLGLDRHDRRLVSLGLLGAGFVAVLLGLFQLMQGPDSPLRFHEFTNRGSSVGFFANRNHHAAFLYCLVPLAVAWGAGLVRRGVPPVSLPVLWAGIIVVALLLGAAMSLSRSGAALAAAALVLSFAMAAEPGGGRRAVTAGLAVAGAVAAFLIAHYALGGLLQRFDRDPLADYRFEILASARDAAAAYFPFGAGFGAFETVYPLHEGLSGVRTAFVNRAHNDWLELAIEGGAPALLLGLVFLGWFSLAAWRAWARPGRGADPVDANLPRAASIAILLVLLHSFVDYPLRTAAMATVLALCAGFLVPPPGSGKDRGRRRRAHGHGGRGRSRHGDRPQDGTGSTRRGSGRRAQAPSPPGR